MTPTELTLRELRRRGYLAQVVERWNPHARVRQDLFGFCDVLALGSLRFGTTRAALIAGESPTLAVQCCASGDAARRRLKVSRHPNLARCLGAGWRVEVWAWSRATRGGKKIGPWKLRVLALG